MSIVLEAARVRKTNTHFDKLPPDILESILNLEYRRKYQEVMRMVRLRSFMNDNFDKYERRNENVARAWALGRCFRTRRLRTDGLAIHSYDLCIGYTTASGTKVALDYTAGGIGFYSMTTSTHVGLVKRYSDRVVNE